MSEVIFHTSGSTGGPKKIVRTDSSLDADAASLVKAFPTVWGSSPTVVSTVRPEHMYGTLWRVRAPLIANSHVDSSIVTSVEELLYLAKKYSNILFVTTPSFLEKALSHQDFKLLKGAFTSIVTSGSLLRKELAAAVYETIGVSPLEIYGSTETGSVAWRRQIDGEEWTLCDGVKACKSNDGALVVDSPYAMTRPFVLSDAVEFTAVNRFVLGSRLDRRVKVLEKFVSLSEVESVLESHPLVSRARAEVCNAGVARIGALVILSRIGVEKLAKGTAEAIAKELRSDLISRLGPEAFPRRIRFVRTFPVNEQGKTLSAAVRDMLEHWCAEPAVLQWSETVGRFSAKVVFPPDLKCFKGHFPSCPILPGVAQLYFLRYFARQVFKSFPDKCVLRRVKFQKIIVPGCEVLLEVVAKSDGIWEFSIMGDNGLCTSGTWQRG